MGVSTDAILVYGIPLDDGVEFPFDDTEDTYYDHKNKPTKLSDPNALEGMVCWGDVIEGLTVETHCSCDYPMYILTVASSRIRAARGNPEAVDPNGMGSMDAFDDSLRAFAKQHNLPHGEPGWYLCSMWC